MPVGIDKRRDESVTIPTYKLGGLKWPALALAVGILALVGCTSNEPHGEIVEQAQRAGAGDLANTSALSIEDWMRKHRDVAVKLNKMCAPVRDKAPASWGDSTEGKVCTAARNATMSTYKYPSDDRSFHSGAK
jgi:hypothetical protein